mmetsp:Transcript_18802/g.40912  ORF Transcript_18802/g.40912 Transcript_18802/m.40912 type:complete len:96 (+) Transcript_18802:1148-1435(+)
MAVKIKPGKKLPYEHDELNIIDLPTTKKENQIPATSIGYLVFGSIVKSSIPQKKEKDTKKSPGSGGSILFILKIFVVLFYCYHTFHQFDATLDVM